MSKIDAIQCDNCFGLLSSIDWHKKEPIYCVYTKSKIYACLEERYDYCVDDCARNGVNYLFRKGFEITSIEAPEEFIKWVEDKFLDPNEHLVRQQPDSNSWFLQRQEEDSLHE